MFPVATAATAADSVVPLYVPRGTDTHAELPSTCRCRRVGVAANEVRTHDCPHDPPLYVHASTLRCNDPNSGVNCDVNTNRPAADAMLLNTPVRAAVLLGNGAAFGSR